MATAWGKQCSREGHSPSDPKRIKKSIQEERPHWQGVGDGGKTTILICLPSALPNRQPNKTAFYSFTAISTSANNHWESQGEGRWRESVAIWLTFRRSACRRSGVCLQLCLQASSTAWGKLLSVFSVSQPKNRKNWPRKIKSWLQWEVMIYPGSTPTSNSKMPKNTLSTRDLCWKYHLCILKCSLSGIQPCLLPLSLSPLVEKKTAEHIFLRWLFYSFQLLTEQENRKTASSHPALPTAG